MRHAVARDAADIACLLLPVDECSLLVPNDCVAEVLPWRRVKPGAGLPLWCLGTLVWRGQPVAVIDFPVIAGLQELPRLNRRAMVIMKRMSVREGAPFFALASAGLPRLLQASEEELQDMTTSGANEAALSTILLGTESVIIPNLRYIEDQVGQYF
jgi:chemosensory pili system protein ChpC